ncbi:hypothetical protein Gasu2_38020 [Galdieria sulphuraria]|nr:hypothetical protein Gasu2_38020 [Galdieria sulphuraria]
MLDFVFCDNVSFRYTCNNSLSTGRRLKKLAYFFNPCYVKVHWTRNQCGFARVANNFTVSAKDRNKSLIAFLVALKV